MQEESIVARDLAQKFGRPPTFIEVTEGVRKRQGDRKVFLPSNIGFLYLVSKH